ncbi:STAS domain-containing protein [Microaerobacter geothermalis]|uniref:STAS domain-containing protein n=1 Tax=Microaerobacter geothermalis TaxID=674972 RepID=UPI001F288BEF|nr:STAS domain-containing protein [Microaerobacter geothermalis]MCF6094368.1 STAS domain-containing protein [Microaerobacter geothermalis]
MKDIVISRIGELVEKLAKGDQQKQVWQDFLVDFAEVCEKADLKEKMKAPISNLLEHISEKELSGGIGLLHEMLDNFPTVEVYDALIEVLGKKNDENLVRIAELRDVLAELSTPIIQLWQDVLLAPVIGTLDSQRAQNMAEKLLESIADTRAKVVIIDVTGVSMIDTVVGEFLIEMFSAVKLLGCDAILTGIKPEIAHTLVKLGIDFDMVIIKRDLESALKYTISKFAKDIEKNQHNQKRGDEDEN